MESVTGRSCRATPSVLDGPLLELQVQELEDAPELRAGVLDQRLVADVDQRGGRVAEEARDRGDIALEDGVVPDRDLVIAVVEGVRVGGEHGQGRPRQHQVAGLRVEPGEKREHERVGRRLVEEERPSRRGREPALVEMIRVGAVRREEVLLAARQPPDQLADASLRDDGVVRGVVHTLVVAEVRQGAIFECAPSIRATRVDPERGADTRKTSFSSTCGLPSFGRGVSLPAGSDRRKPDHVPLATRYNPARGPAGGRQTDPI
jgi:hypothetical protein